MPSPAVNNEVVGYPTQLQVPFGVAQYLPSSLWGCLYADFNYLFAQLPLDAAAAATPVTVTIESDSHYALCGFNFDARTAADHITGAANPPILALFRDLGSGTDLQSDATPLVSLAGVGQLPGIRVVPRLLKANSSLRVQLTNLDPANAFDVRIATLGFKIYGVPRNDPNIKPVSGGL